MEFEFKKKSMKKKIYIVLSIFIAYLLISPNDIMWAKDREWYLVYAQFSLDMIVKNLTNGIVVFLANEPLFLLINSILSLVFSPENTINIIIFISSFLTLYSLGRLSKNKLIIIVLFAISPTVLLKYTTHIRQGLAMSIYFLGLVGYLENKKYRYLMYLSPLVHSSMAFIIVYEIFELFFKKIKFTSGLRLLASSIFLTTFMLSIPKIAFFLGDRRAQEYVFNLDLSGSGIGFFIWLLAGVCFITFKKNDFISTICSYGIVFYLISYFYLDFGARIFESIFPLIILSSVTDKRLWFRSSYTLFLIGYAILLWFSGARWIF